MVIETKTHLIYSQLFRENCQNVQDNIGYKHLHIVFINHSWKKVGILATVSRREMAKNDAKRQMNFFSCHRFIFFIFQVYYEYIYMYIFAYTSKKKRDKLRLLNHSKHSSLRTRDIDIEATLIIIRLSRIWSLSFTILILHFRWVICAILL